LSSVSAQLQAEMSDAAQLRKAVEAERKDRQRLILEALVREKEQWDELHSQKMLALETKLRTEYEAEINESKRRDASLKELMDRLRMDAATATQHAQAQGKLVSDLVKKITQHEDEHKRLKTEWESEKGDLQEHVSSLLKEISRKTEEFNKLMDVKITLQSEIEHYRYA
jgi:exopolyphosphatase/pppGpp-phosphohydrolase